jgi:hypothetical protein
VKDTSAPAASPSTSLFVAVSEQGVDNAVDLKIVPRV